MNYMTELIEADLKYICSVIPYKETTEYFKRYPKEFARLRPGFRVTSLSEREITRTLFDFRNRNFVSTFIVKHIDNWLKEIKEALEQAEQKGLNTEEAYIQVLSQSIFSHNIPLYFKIVGEEKTKDFLCVMTAGVNQLFELHDNIEVITKKHVKDISSKNSMIQKLKAEAKEAEEIINKLRVQVSDADLKAKAMSEVTEQKDGEIKRLNDYVDELKSEAVELHGQIEAMSSDYEGVQTVLTKQNGVLKKQVEELEHEMTSTKEKMIKLRKSTETMDSIKTQITMVNKAIQSLSECRTSYESRIDELKQLIECALEHGKNSLSGNIKTAITQRVPVMPIHPVNMDDFDEYFKYNLNNIGLEQKNEDCKLFIKFIENVVFNGMPLLIKHSPGLNLANCLANTIYGQKTAAILSYSGTTDIERIKDLLDVIPDRVVCLDGFVGNCNEIELITLLEQYRDKVLFLTYMYDRTLNYLPMEILMYVRYINVDELKPLLGIKDITEDPSTIVEESYAFGNEALGESRYQRIFAEIANQCGFCKDVINSLAAAIDSEDYMDSLLLFSVLPYVSKVMQINPYNCSKRLQKYAGEFGKCPYKEIMQGWFG